ncbi:MAG: hypothetical protein P8Q37_02115 [Porticoccaceae bacterium]|nr:hypothetical protein [Porticoccaceae bacterium]MDG1473668.1 hypothetical protein [Porticoccaceae bacterium]
MKIISIGLLAICLSSCASTRMIDERIAAQETADHEECISYGFSNATEAYGGCRLTLKSIRAQEKNTDALRFTRRDMRWCRGYYCW